MRVYISYHQDDKRYKKKLVKLLNHLRLEYYSIPDKIRYNEEALKKNRELISENIKKCEVSICLVGKSTYKDKLVKSELEATIKARKGLVGIVLEKRLDNKNNIDKTTFPEAIHENYSKEKPYAVLLQYASMEDEFLSAFFKAKSNSYLA